MVAGRAVFLDRDGVLAVPEFRDGRSFAPRRVADFRLYNDASASAARLRAGGFTLVVVTNQPDVGDGLVELSVVEEMHRIMAAALPVDAIESCYHGHHEVCDCRKPKPGMLRRAAERFGVDCRRSFMVGDRGSDVAAGEAVGCTTILIDLGYTGVDLGSPDHKVASLSEATDIILASD
jgi:D-glycero-D-manno-heptose 1,7-bisphosphate phosphatase